MIEEVEETRQEVLFLQKTCPEDLLPSDDGYDSEDSYLPDPNDPSWHLWEDIRRPAFVRSESRPYFWDVDNRQDFRDALEGLQRQRNQVSRSLIVSSVLLTVSPRRTPRTSFPGSEGKKRRRRRSWSSSICSAARRSRRGSSKRAGSLNSAFARWCWIPRRGQAKQALSFPAASSLAIGLSILSCRAPSCRPKAVRRQSFVLSVLLLTLDSAS